MRLSVDTNILVYSVKPEDRRSLTARRIMTGAMAVDSLLTNQVIGEFFNVVRKKLLVSLEEARRAATDWSLLYPIAPTATEHLIAASALSEQQRLQYWDAVILTVSRSAGADCLLTEDMQDGATLNGVRIVNPFNPANAELLDLLLTPAP